MNVWDTLSVFNKPGSREKDSRKSKSKDDGKKDPVELLKQFVYAKKNPSKKKSKGDDESDEPFSCDQPVRAISAFSLCKGDGAAAKKKLFKPAKFFDDKPLPDLEQLTNDLDKLKEAELEDDKYVQVQDNVNPDVVYEELPTDALETAAPTAQAQKEADGDSKEAAAAPTTVRTRHAKRLYAAQARVLLSDLEVILCQDATPSTDFPAQPAVMRAATFDPEDEDAVESPPLDNLIDLEAEPEEPEPEDSSGEKAAPAPASAPKVSGWGLGKQTGLYNPDTFERAVSLWNPKISRNNAFAKGTSPDKWALKGKGARMPLSVIDVEHIMAKLEEVLQVTSQWEHPHRNQRLQLRFMWGSQLRLSLSDPGGGGPATSGRP